jgi:hypothetical protein
MEILDTVSFLIVIIGHSVQAFAAYNLMQFFRGQETILEALVKKAQKNEA